MNLNWKLIIKITTGIIVVPFAILSNALWPWWQKASMLQKIISAPFVFPIVLFSYLTSFWWNDL